jgi:hypothetical protein
VIATTIDPTEEGDTFFNFDRAKVATVVSSHSLTRELLILRM